MVDIEKMIKDGATIVDVRTPAEYQMACAPNTINIPLNEIPQRLDEFKSLKQPLLVCCQSGGRSGQAHAYLNDNGISCENAGSWISVNYAFAQMAQ